MAKKAAGSERNKFLDGVREHMLETKARLLAEMDTDQKAQREGNKDEGMDAYDLASEERDREINFILSDRERAKIKDIDDALARLAEQSYGICEECGLDIGEERLEALPFTRVCRDCQQDREREAKLQRNFDSEDRAYRKVGSTDGDENNM
jgi:DnaK suppressor protein